MGYVGVVLEKTAEQVENREGRGKAFLRSSGFIVTLAAVSVVIGMIPVAGRLLLPFKFFTTLIHEGGHALAAVLLGGDVQQIVINPDSSGYTRYISSESSFTRGVIATSGYLGTSLFGGVLIVLATFDKLAKPLMFLMGAIVGAAVLLYVRDAFSIFLCAAFTVALVWISVRGSVNLNYFFVNLLAVQCALNAIGDVIGLAMISSGAPKSEYSLDVSDADVMADLFFLPAIVWSVLWIIVSIIILLYSLRLSASIRAGQSKIKG